MLRRIYQYPSSVGLCAVASLGSDAREAHNYMKLSCCTSNYMKLECGPMPNVMVALPNIGGALCSTPQSLADAHY